MTDLVERLRSVPAVSYADCREAADEIERLRAEVERQRLELGITEDACGMLESEVKQLRARVAELEARNYKLRAWLQASLDSCSDPPEWTFGTAEVVHMRNLIKGEDAPLPEPLP